MKTNYYSVGDHAFHISMPEKDIDLMLSTFTPFQIDCDNTEKMLFQISSDSSLRPSSEGEHIGCFDCGNAIFDIYIKQNKGYRFLISPPGLGLCGILETSHNFTLGKINYRGKSDSKHLAVNNAIMLMYAFAATRHNTLLIHASVVMNKGNGYLFIGKSGAGKSTHSRLWLESIKGSELINDDNPVIRVYKNNQIKVFGSPWSGKTPCYKQLSTPVKAIVRINKDIENKIVRETPAGAFASLLPTVSTMKWDDDLFSKLCDTISTIISVVPVFKLNCKADHDAAKVCFNAISSNKI